MLSIFRKVAIVGKKYLAQFFPITATIIKLNDFMFVISFTSMLNLKINIEMYVNDFIQKTTIQRKYGLVSQRTILPEFGYWFLS